MGRIENLTIFNDTEKLCKENNRLANAVKQSTDKQVLIPEEDTMSESKKELYDKPAKVLVSKKRTYEAASAYKDKKVCVHNFASATNPGGGVVKGANAQEECLCRCSTLYFNLNTKEMWNGFYEPHRKERNPLHNDDCIYTPNVVVFKTDTANPILMQEKDWYSVNVITCAAPNLREKPSNAMNPGEGTKVKISDKELLSLHEKRMRRILDIAAENGNEVVILGAFGCGAFSNSPEVVARAMKNVVKEYLFAFKVIEFAVYCSPKDDSNYKVFERIIRL